MNTLKYMNYMRGIKFRYKLNKILDGMVDYGYFESQYRRKTFFMFASLYDTSEFYLVPFKENERVGMVYQHRADNSYASIPFNVWSKVIELSLIEEFNDIPILRKEVDEIALAVLKRLDVKVCTTEEFDEISKGYTKLKKVVVA